MDPSCLVLISGRDRDKVRRIVKGFAHVQMAIRMNGDAPDQSHARDPRIPKSPAQQNLAVLHIPVLTAHPHPATCRAGESPHTRPTGTDWHMRCTWWMLCSAVATAYISGSADHMFVGSEASPFTVSSSEADAGHARIEIASKSRSRPLMVAKIGEARKLNWNRDSFGESIRQGRSRPVTGLEVADICIYRLSIR
ncbi:unnamed protein product [Mycena citricolor]|uniref:Uncharacterized protein n=1 Tax=Mycena citricolor TaxID=2018698 RepID=A0AAD2HJH7_9AGAR|nr:unnamed protein product [Mycena citricolor]